MIMKALSQIRFFKKNLGDSFFCDGIIKEIKTAIISLAKKAIISCLVLSLFSCGLKAVYKDRDSEKDISYVDELSAIRIKKDRNALHQEMKNNLYDLFEVNTLKTEPKYFMVLRISKNVSSTFTTATGASGRNRITLNVDYDLKDLADGKLLSTGGVSVNDGYDISTNRYGTLVSEDYAINNLVKSAAKNIRNLIVNDITEIKKQEAKNKAEQNKPKQQQ